MTVSGLVFLASVALGLSWLMWRMATMKTDPGGYSRIAMYTDKGEVNQAKRILEKAGIPFQLDDHSGHGYRGGVVTQVRVLVLSDRIAEAENLLKDVRIKRSEEDNDEEGHDDDAPPA
jgi:putative signal transducing protein